MRISTEPSEMDIAAIHRFLSNESYWAKGVSTEAVRKGIANSLCFAGFIGQEQVAFGRAATDMTRFAYLMDIYVLPAFRGKGYGKQLVGAMLDKLEQEGVATLMLATQDAHDLYRSFGFDLVGDSPKLMRRVRSPC